MWFPLYFVLQFYWGNILEFLVKFFFTQLCTLFWEILDTLSSSHWSANVSCTPSSSWHRLVNYSYNMSAFLFQTMITKWKNNPTSLSYKVLRNPQYSLWLSSWSPREGAEMSHGYLISWVSAAFLPGRKATHFRDEHLPRHWLHEVGHRHNEVLRQVRRCPPWGWLSHTQLFSLICVSASFIWKSDFCPGKIF